jgi:peptidoglycan/LPS O-acetylase OafA/YrhL
MLIIAYFWASVPILFLNFFSNSSSFPIMDIYLYSSPIFRLGEFILGVLLYIIFIEKARFPIKISKYILILCYVILTIYFIKVDFFNGLSAFNFIAIPIISISILYLHNNKNFILNNKVFVYLGHISYSFYLAQFVVFGAFKTEIKNFSTVSIELKWGLAFLITILIAMLMYHIIEEPSRDYIRSKYR